MNLVEHDVPATPAAVRIVGDVVGVGGAEREERRGHEFVHAREVFTGCQQAVVQVGIDVDALLPQRLGEHGQRQELPMGVPLVAQGVAEHADVVRTAQADVGERAGLVDDPVQQLGVVIENGHQSERVQGQGALVGGAEHVFAIRVRCR